MPSSATLVQVVHKTNVPLLYTLGAGARQLRQRHRASALSQRLTAQSGKHDTANRANTAPPERSGAETLGKITGTDSR